MRLVTAQGYQGSMNSVAGFTAELRRRGVLDSSIRKYGDNLRAWIRWTGDPWAASTEDVQVFLDGRKGRAGHLSPRTRYAWVSCLHSYYAWATDEGLCEHDPTARIVRPKQRAGLPRPIATSDLIKALGLADPRMRAWLCLGAFAGLRCAEMGRLEAADVQRDAGLIRVLGKGEKERMVPLHPAVVAALDGHGYRPRGPIFRTAIGTACSGPYVSSTIRQWFASVGIPATAHQLRHWFGTEAYKACRDIRVVQGLLGHASPNTTAIYTAWANEDARTAVLALPALGQDPVAEEHAVA